MADDTIKIDAAGRVTAGPGAVERLRAHAGEYRVVPTTGDLLVLQRAQRTGPTTATRVVLAGEIDRQGGLVDVIHFVHSNGWSGQLSVVVGDVRKALYFRRGDIHTAASNVADDRLGAILYRFGIISSAQLQAAVAASTGSAARLGQTLVEQKIITAHDVYTYMRKQVEEIFFSLLSFRSGEFYFMRTAEDAGPRSQLQLSTQALLFEGVKRIDELSLFRQRLPSMDMVLVRREPAPVEKLGDTEQRVLDLTDGRRTLDAIARESHLGEFETIRMMYRLLTSGWVQPRPRETTLQLKAVETSSSAVGTYRKIVETFNEVYARIHSAVAGKGREQVLSSGLESFFGSVAEFAPLFSGIQAGTDGRLPVDTLLVNLEMAPTEDRLDYLHRGLNELLFFELFTAGEAVDRREEIELHQRLNTILRDVPPTGEALEPEISIERG